MSTKRPMVTDGVTLWRCSKCREWKPAGDYYPRASASNGLRAQCKSCHNATSVRTRDEEKHRRQNRRYMRRARQRDPEKFRKRERQASRERCKDERYRSRLELNNAVKYGKIERPDACERCGTEGAVEGHHEDYSRPLDGAGTATGANATPTRTSPPARPTSPPTRCPTTAWRRKSRRASSRRSRRCSGRSTGRASHGPAWSRQDCPTCGSRVTGRTAGWK